MTAPLEAFGFHPSQIHQLHCWNSPKGQELSGRDSQKDEALFRKTYHAPCTLVGIATYMASEGPAQAAGKRP